MWKITDLLASIKQDAINSYRGEVLTVENSAIKTTLDKGSSAYNNKGIKPKTESTAMTDWKPIAIGAGAGLILLIIIIKVSSK